MVDVAFWERLVNYPIKSLTCTDFRSKWVISSDVSTLRQCSSQHFVEQRRHCEKVDNNWVNWVRLFHHMIGDDYIDDDRHNHYPLIRRVSRHISSPNTVQIILKYYSGPVTLLHVVCEEVIRLFTMATVCRFIGDSWFSSNRCCHHRLIWADGPHKKTLCTWGFFSIIFSHASVCSDFKVDP